MFALILWSTLVLGCAARSHPTSDEVRGLRDRVGQLERARLQQHQQLETLTDRLNLLESQQQPPAERPRLPVVRVAPRAGPSAASSPPAEHSPRGAFEPIFRERRGPAPEPDQEYAAGEKGQRPVLRLGPPPRSPPPGRPPRGGTRASYNFAQVNERLALAPLAPPVNQTLAPASTTPSSSTTGRQSLASPPSTSSPDELLSRARRAGTGCGTLVEELARFVADHPDHEAAPEALFLRGRCLRRSGAPMRALGELERLVNRYGASQFQGQVWLEMAEAYAAVGDLARAQQLWRQTKETFPGSPAASRAQARSRAIRNGSVSREEP